jgi:hypothetical protein
VSLVYETKHLNTAVPAEIKRLQDQRAAEKDAAERAKPVNDKPLEWTTRTELRITGRKSYFSLSGERKLGFRELGRMDYTTA